MQTLLDFLPAIHRLGPREAVRFNNGFRTWRTSYGELYERIAAVAGFLKERRIAKGDRILLWGEGCAEWIAVFWGGVARGVRLVPVDCKSSSAFVERVRRESGARLLFHGSTVNADDLDIERLSFSDIRRLPAAEALQTVEAAPGDIVEIVYTSGTTAEPHGIEHRHRNICANLRPFRDEIEKYRTWAAPFQPLRILDLLPLSHLFGQALGLYIPVLLEGSVVFMLEMHPGSISGAVKRERVSVLVCVPRVLENLRGDAERRFHPDEFEAGHGWLAVARRWWKFRNIHRTFGLKFWCFVVGGAELAPGLESFWSKLGFLVIQGYGLTETSPVVAVNHPFGAKRGSLGRAIPGQEIQIAQDGEILVRGESVVGEGWLHTGDIGEMDVEGRLYYRGRKKDLIVTPDGLNVHPQDVEAVLNRQAQVREAVVVARKAMDGDHVHAVFVLSNPAANIEDLVRQANIELEPHQKIRSWSVWPDSDFPRTPSTQKVMRRLVAAQVSGSVGARGPYAAVSSLEELLGNRLSRPADQIRNDQLLAEDLGLSSLERVDLLSELESVCGADLDEQDFAAARTVGELKRWLAAAKPSAGCRAAGAATSAVDVPEPRWSRWMPVLFLRGFTQRVLILPLTRYYARVEVRGHENLEGLSPPVIFVANHVSHFDTPVILAALPPGWRRRVAPAMATEFFRPFLERRGPFRFKRGIEYYSACAFFGAYPLPHEMGGVRRSLRYTGELIEHGSCPLLYPEGERSVDGALQPFRAGIGLMAVRLQVPVVPIHLAGLERVFPVGAAWPRPGHVRVRIGAPIRVEDRVAFEDAARKIEKAVRDLALDHGSL